MADPDVERLMIRDLELSFGGVRALQGVSMHVDAGEVLGIIGPNGAGKTSLVNCVTGFYEPQSGSVQYGSTELTGRTPQEVLRHGIVRTFQLIEVIPESTVLDNVLLGLHRFLDYGLLRSLVYLGHVARTEERYRQEALSALETMGLREYAHERISDLPYGLQKATEISRALVARPSLLILDEPAAGMAGEESRSLADQIRTVVGDTGVAVALIEHDVEFVMSLCDRIVVLDRGNVIASGTPSEVRQDSVVQEAYLGVEA